MWIPSKIKWREEHRLRSRSKRPDSWNKSKHESKVNDPEHNIDAGPTDQLPVRGTSPDFNDAMNGPTLKTEDQLIDWNEERGDCRVECCPEKTLINTSRPGTGSSLDAEPKIQKVQAIDNKIIWEREFDDSFRWDEVPEETGIKSSDDFDFWHLCAFKEADSHKKTK